MFALPTIHVRFMWQILERGALFSALMKLALRIWKSRCFILKEKYEFICKITF